MASPQTVVRGNDQSTAQYALAPGVFQYIESVLIEVDTSGSGDVTPTLSVQTQDGVTLAEKAQGVAITAGGTGRATWALRLTDETVSGPAPASSDLLYDCTIFADQFAIDTMVDGPMAGPLSADYAALHFTAITRTDSLAVGVGANARVIVNNDSTNANYTYMLSEWPGTPGGMTGGPVQNNKWTVRTFGAGGTSGYYATMEGTLPGYAEFTGRRRNVQILAGDIDPVGPAGVGFIDTLIGVWKNNDAIDRIAVTAQSGANKLVSDSRLTVYGWGRL